MWIPGEGALEYYRNLRTNTLFSDDSRPQKTDRAHARADHICNNHTFTGETVSYEAGFEYPRPADGYFEYDFLSNQRAQYCLDMNARYAVRRSEHTGGNYRSNN